MAKTHRRIRYAVAMSLDGFIAGPNGESDWITTDPSLDFGATFRQFDTILVGRRTFGSMVAAGQTSLPGMATIVFSRTLRPEEYPGITIVARDQNEVVAALKSSPGKDVWLFGGGGLFRSLAEAGQVDTVEVSILPILLGAGVPLLPDTGSRIGLTLTSHKVYPTGIIGLEYAIT